MVLDEKSPQEYPINAGVPQGSILCPTFFLLYINDLPGDVICNIAIYADATTLYFKYDEAFDLESDLQENVDWGRKWLVDFEAEKTQLILFDQPKSTGAIDMKMDRFLLEEKSYFKILGLTFSYRLDLGSYIISITKAASKKIGVSICPMKFPSPEVGLYIYKSTIWVCMEYCSDVWAGGPNCYLELLNKPQKRVCSTVGPSLIASLESLAHRQM